MPNPLDTDVREHWSTLIAMFRDYRAWLVDQLAFVPSNNSTGEDVLLFSTKADGINKHILTLNALPAAERTALIDWAKVQSVDNTFELVPYMTAVKVANDALVAEVRVVLNAVHNGSGGIDHLDANNFPLTRKLNTDGSTTSEIFNPASLASLVAPLAAVRDALMP